jgi:hypothetical protein
VDICREKIYNALQRSFLCIACAKTIFRHDKILLHVLVSLSFTQPELFHIVLAPLLGNFHVVHLKYHFAARVSDHGCTVIVLKQIKHADFVTCVLPGEPESFRCGFFALAMS